MGMKEMGVLKKIAEANLGAHISVHVPWSFSNPIPANDVVDAAKWAINRIDELESYITKKQSSVAIGNAVYYEVNSSSSDFPWGTPLSPDQIWKTSRYIKPTNWFSRPDRWHEFGGW